MEKKYQAADSLFYSLQNDEDNNFITGFTQGVDWSIDKACEYLKLNRYNVETEDNGIAGWIPDEFIEDFRKAMEE